MARLPKAQRTGSGKIANSVGSSVPADPAERMVKSDGCNNRSRTVYPTKVMLRQRYCAQWEFQRPCTAVLARLLRLCVRPHLGFSLRVL